MTYLHPPPGDAPVIVTKDVGGYVNEYGAQTRLYFETGREVRLHECRSACTLALSLPTVCVYPDSLLKFHKAYDLRTKIANEEISEQLMASYPPAVREKLGELTRNYKVLTGSELIRLGIRDCNRPLAPNYAVARARSAPATHSAQDIFGSIAEVFSPAGAPASGVQVKAQRVRVATAQVNPPKLEPKPAATPGEDLPAAPTPEEPAPTPPIRPADLLPPAAPTPAPATPAPPTPAAEAAPTQAEVRISSNWGRPIVGSAPILVSTRFSPFPYRAARRS